MPWVFFALLGSWSAELPAPWTYIYMYAFCGNILLPSVIALVGFISYLFTCIVISETRSYSLNQSLSMCQSWCYLFPRGYERWDIFWCGNYGASGIGVDTCVNFIHYMVWHTLGSNLVRLWPDNFGTSGNWYWYQFYMRLWYDTDWVQIWYLWLEADTVSKLS